MGVYVKLIWNCVNVNLSTWSQQNVAGTFVWALFKCRTCVIKPDWRSEPVSTVAALRGYTEPQRRPVSPAGLRNNRSSQPPGTTSLFAPLTLSPSPGCRYKLHKSTTVSGCLNPCCWSFTVVTVDIQGVAFFQYPLARRCDRWLQRVCHTPGLSARHYENSHWHTSLRCSRTHRGTLSRLHTGSARRGSAPVRSDSGRTQVRFSCLG